MFDSSKVEELATELSETRKSLNAEITIRRGVVKPIENALRALKDPHKNAVALHEATAALQSGLAAAPVPESFSATVAELRKLADEQVSELEFTFARDLRAAFQEKGVTLEGSPSALVADIFLMQPDMRKKKVEITFSRQPVTLKTVKLDVGAVIAAYERAQKEICGRNVDEAGFLADLFETYQRLLKLGGHQVGFRTGIVDLYAELVWVRQPQGFRRTLAKANFTDYPKSHFLYDIFKLRQGNMTVHNGHQLNLGISTIEVGSDSRKAMFLATTATQGTFYKDLYFTLEKGK